MTYKHSPKPASLIAPRGPGRPAYPPELRRNPTTLRLTPAERAKLDALGGRAWLSAQLAKARTP